MGICGRCGGGSRGAVIQRNITKNNLKLGDFLEIINPFVCGVVVGGGKAIVRYS